MLSDSLGCMSPNQFVPFIALLFVLCPLGGCKKKKKKPPSDLAALSPDQACKHFFGRVKACASSINRIKAGKLGLKGAQHRSYVRQRTEQLNRAFSNIDLLCERYEKKARKQQTDMNKCYRQTSCEAFGQCFVKMADADPMSGGGVGPGSLQKIRKKLLQLKNKRPGRPGGHSHGHMHAPGPGPAAMTKPPPRPTPRPMTKPRPRP